MEVSFVLDEEKADLRIELVQTVGAQVGAVVAGTVPEGGMENLLHRTGAHARQFIHGSPAGLVTQRNGQMPSAGRWTEFAHFLQRERGLALRADVANFDLDDAADRKLLEHAVVEEAMHWAQGGRDTEMHAVYRSKWAGVLELVAGSHAGARIATKSSRDTPRRQRSRVRECRRCRNYSVGQ